MKNFDEFDISNTSTEIIPKNEVMFENNKCHDESIIVVSSPLSVKKNEDCDITLSDDECYNIYDYDAKKEPTTKNKTLDVSLTSHMLEVSKGEKEVNDSLMKKECNLFRFGGEFRSIIF